MIIIIECACFCLSQRQHVTGAFVISLAPAALWSESSHIQNIMSLGVFFFFTKGSGWKPPTHQPSNSEKHYNCVSVDSERYLSWKDFFFLWQMSLVCFFLNLGLIQLIVAVWILLLITHKNSTDNKFTLKSKLAFECTTKCNEISAEV